MKKGARTMTDECRVAAKTSWLDSHRSGSCTQRHWRDRVTFGIGLERRPGVDDLSEEACAARRPNPCRPVHIREKVITRGRPQRAEAFSLLSAPKRASSN